jgi:hypothetical protein
MSDGFSTLAGAKIWYPYCEVHKRKLIFSWEYFSLIMVTFLDTHCVQFRTLPRSAV